MTQSENANRLTPYICVRDAAEAIAFYIEAFGATEKFRLTDPESGKIGHAEIDIGGALIMLSDEYPDFGALSPDTVGGSPTKLHLYVEDADAVFKHAMSAGATELRPLKTEFFGDRTGSLQDPFGHVWMVATRVETVSPAEMQTRWSEAMSGS